MKSTRSSINEKLKRALFAFSGNQCAHPQCSRKLVEKPTLKSPQAIIGEIAHIYPVSKEGGPRGKYNDGIMDINSFENLILLCRDHHRLVDTQPDTYPPEVLLRWKEQHMEKVENNFDINIERDLYEYGPKKLVNQKIIEELEIIRKSIWLSETNNIAKITEFGLEIDNNGWLSSGSSDIRCKALAQCSRYLSAHNNDLARKFFDTAQKLGNNLDTQIAKICIEVNSGKFENAAEKLLKLESPTSRTISLMMMSRIPDQHIALKWFETRIMNLKQLDSDGKMQLLLIKQDLELWDDALILVNEIESEDLLETPALHHAIAMTKLIAAVPEHLRKIVNNQLPYAKNDYSSLNREPEFIELRRSAKDHFLNFSDVAGKLNCFTMAETAKTYALWIELEDPSTKKLGIERLKNLIRNSESLAFHLVPIGIAYGIITDLKALEEEITRYTSNTGIVTFEILSAHLALAVNQKTEIENVNFIVRRKDFLLKHYSWQFIEFIHIEALCRAGLKNEANEQLNKAIKMGLTEQEIERLNDVINSWFNSDTVDEEISNFEESMDIMKYGIFLNRLATEGKWQELVKHGEKYYKLVQNDDSIKLYAQALYNVGNYEHAIQFLESLENREAIATLQLIYCGSLFFTGEALKAQKELPKLEDGISSKIYRDLYTNVHISIGEWNIFQEFLIKCKSCIEEIEPDELLKLAKLSIYTNSNLEKEFIFAAVDKGKNEPNILSNAYFLSSLTKWEHKDEPQKWLNKAYELSGKSGPLQKTNLKEFLKQNSLQQQHQSELNELFAQGEIPIFAVADAQNDTLAKLMMHSAWSNMENEDARTRSYIPAYSGNLNIDRSISANSVICLDLTALITLHNLNLLEMTLNSFDKVYIPHSTTNWLFNERNEIQFHQPSRIEESHYLQDLKIRNMVQLYNNTNQVDNELAIKVGPRLASFLVEALKSNSPDKSQKIVVRPAPVNHINPMIDEEVDLNEYKSVICGCLPIIEELRKQSKISTAQYKEATNYLKMEQQWPEKFKIKSNATLFISSLALSYFLRLSYLLRQNILEKIVNCGFKVYVDEISTNMARSLLKYEDFTKQISENLENIMGVLQKFLMKGKLSIGKINLPLPDDILTKLIMHPSNNLESVIENCDSIIVDDRFFNRNKQMSNSNSSSNISTTYSILKFLLESNKIDKSKFYDLKFQLRQMGYFFVPIELNELEYIFQEFSEDENGQFVESTELKAIRENILAVRMRNWLQIPGEMSWIWKLMRCLNRALVAIWATEKSEQFKIGCSDWIIELTKIQPWAHVFKERTLEDLQNLQVMLDSMLVISIPDKQNIEVQKKYWKWLKATVISPLKEENPKMYEKLLDSCQEFVTLIKSNELNEFSLQ